MKAKYRHLSLPERLMFAIDDYIENNPHLDLRSRAEVVKLALRKMFIEENK